MVKRNLKPFVFATLLFVCAGTSYATSCGIPTPEEAEFYARQDGWNLLVKGFLWGLILSAYLFNLAWFVLRTQRWFTAVILSLLLIPIVFGFWFGEILSQPCGFGGLEAKYYLLPLAAFVLVGIVQYSLADQRPISIVPD